MTHALADFFWQLEIAANVGSVETRKTGTTKKCVICEEPVEVIEDRIERLTSYGSTFVWRRRSASAHRRSCYDAANELVRKALAAAPVDLWDRS